MIARFLTGSLSLLLALGASGGASAQTENGEWRSYGADIANTRYAPLDQIDADNFNDLELAWRFRTDSFGPRSESLLQSTPLMVGGVVYSTVGSRRAVVALDAVTGEILWMHRLDEGERGDAAPRRLSGRGLAYRDDGGSGQIFYVTPGYRLLALDAATGLRIPSFGDDGIVDLKTNIDQDLDPLAEIGLHAAPIVAGNMVIVGAAHLPGGAPSSREKPKGYIRGYDATSGERSWIFHTIPTGDEFGNDTWDGDSWRYTGNTGVWAQIAVDEELGLVYLPVEAPTGDYYGGHRHGDNLFSGSVVAVDIETGERAWHYQTVHHDVWDWDLPAGPVLVDITVDGREIKALVQPTKQSWLFVLDRETGEPVWPIEERPVPPSDVPGELLSPTQPFPTRPPALDRQGLSEDDLIDFTPELRVQAAALLSRYRLGGIYEPPSVSVADGTLGTIQMPNSTGGVNWPGGSVDPATGVFYQYTKTQVGSLGLVNDPERSDMDYISARPPGVSRRVAPLNLNGFPIVKPPWGRISAVDLNTGKIVWQVPHGEAPDNIRNHDVLGGIDIGRTGWPGRIGTLVTRTLVIAGGGGFHTTPTDESGSMLYAYDKASGAQVGAVYMPAPQTGSPMTYMADGRQYIIVAVSGSGQPAELVAYRLPE